MPSASPYPLVPHSDDHASSSILMPDFYHLVMHCNHVSSPPLPQSAVAHVHVSFGLPPGGRACAVGLRGSRAWRRLPEARQGGVVCPRLTEGGVVCPRLTMVGLPEGCSARGSRGWCRLPEAHWGIIVCPGLRAALDVHLFVWAGIGEGQLGLVATGRDSWLVLAGWSSGSC